MKITRINKIKKHRVFEHFSWSPPLLDFGRFNLLYGWNGSGKTTLSNLFRSIERKQTIPIDQGEVEYFIDGHSCDGNSLGSGT